MHVRCKALLLILIPAVLFFHTTPAKASHAAGGELLYEWVSGNTYTVYFKFYRDCSGVAENDAVNLCYWNSCDPTPFSAVLKKMKVLPAGIPNGSPVTVGCSSYGTTCTDPSSALPGYREWWYSGSVTLPLECDSWRFSTSISARNPNMNIITTATTTLFVEATLNNKDAPTNSSPFFSVKPVPYVCNGQNYTYNNGASDKDNDSLSFEMIAPMDGVNCNGYPLTFAVDSPPLNLVDNPFQTFNTFSLNPVTGQISFTPFLLGAQTVAVKVNEYRRGKKIGSVVRDIQVSSLPCNSMQPEINLDPHSLQQDTVIGDIIQVCAGVPMGFCFDAKSKDPDAVLVVSDNHGAVVPGAGVYYTGQKSNAVRTCFYWTPQKADAGLKIFAITVKDSTCKPPGISISQTFTVPINVRLAENSAFDTAVCLGDTIQLHPLVGSQFAWDIFYGTANSLSCNTCATPHAWPIINSAYLVRTEVNAFCGRNVDTILVHVKTDIPSIPEVSSNTPVCYADTLLLFGSPALNAGYRWHGPNDFEDTTQNPVIPFATFDNEGTYYLQTQSYNSFCLSKPNYTKVDILPIPHAFFQYTEDICIGETATIRPDRDYNSRYYWDFAGASRVDTSRLNIHYASWQGTGSRNVILKLQGQNGCFSIPDTGTINIHDLPEAKIISANKDGICTGDTISINAAIHNGYTYTWLPRPYFTATAYGAANGVIPQTGYIYLNVQDQWGCVNHDSLFVNTIPCCDAWLPNAFTPNGDGKNDVFRIITPGHHTIQKFMVLNRWGQEVFGSADERSGWDGTRNGVPQEPGTYFYYLRYRCSDNQVFEKKGEVTLIR